MNRSIVVVAILLLVAGCARTTYVGPVKTDTESVEMGSAQTAAVDIEMGAGELNVTGGADKLMSGVFTHNVGVKRPDVQYEVIHDHGRLSVHQPSRNVTFDNLLATRRYRNKWDLQLNSRIPTDLEINLGAGTADLELSGMALTHLKLSCGAGSARIDLTGDWTRGLDLEISGGVGGATLRLPSKVGVKVDVEGGIGSVDAYGFSRAGRSYVNDAYGKSPITLAVHIEAGIGSVNLELGD